MAFSTISAFILLSITFCVSASPTGFRPRSHLGNDPLCTPDFKGVAVSITSSNLELGTPLPAAAGNPVNGASERRAMYEPDWVITNASFNVGFNIREVDHTDLLATIADFSADNVNQTLSLAPATNLDNQRFDIWCHECGNFLQGGTGINAGARCNIASFAEQLCVTIDLKNISNPLYLSQCTLVADQSQYFDFWTKVTKD